MRRPSPARVAGASALAGLLLGGLAVPALAGGGSPDVPRGSGLQQAELVGYAALPALTFGEQIPSGAAVADANGVDAPFAAQPVQGFSGLLRDGADRLVLSDNGYGTKANSADYLLRVNRLAIDPAGGGVTVLGGFGLSDPDHRLPFPLVRADRR